MTKNKWLDLIDMVETKFKIDENYKEPMNDGSPGEKHIVEFTGPMGKIKLEFTEKARLADVKTIYSGRVGSDVTINKIYDEEDIVSHMNAYKWDEIRKDWVTIQGDLF